MSSPGDAVFNAPPNPGKTEGTCEAPWLKRFSGLGKELWPPTNADKNNAKPGFCRRKSAFVGG
jgi:hypothetical protein